MESTYIRVIKHPGREGRVFFMTGHRLSIILQQINLNAEGEPQLKFNDNTYNLKIAFIAIT